jgi:hypothetical protein
MAMPTSFMASAIGGHVGQQDEHALAFLHGEFLGHRQRHVRDQQALDHRIGGQVDEHHRARKHAGVLELRRKK